MDPDSSALTQAAPEVLSVLGELQDLARNPTRTSELDERISKILSTGRLQPLRREILESARPLPLELDLLAADAGVRVQLVAPSELRRLFHLVDNVDDPNLGLWFAAISAECHIWKGDLTGVSIAHVGLADADRATRSVGRVARARLRRLVALAATLAGESGVEIAEQMSIDACSEFEREGQLEELAVTTGMLATIRVVSGANTATAETETIRNSAELAQILGSDRVPLMYVGFAWASAVQWDFETLELILRRLKGVSERDVGPVVYDLIEIVQLAAKLEQRGATPELVDRAHRIFGSPSRRFLVVPSAALFIATLLLDSGDWEAAEGLIALATSSTMMLTPYSETSVREIGARLRLLRDRNPDEVEELLSTADMWSDTGHERHAAQICLRGALDCERAGFRNEGARLRSRGVELLPPPNDRTAWETNLLAQAVIAADPQPLGELLVMGDDLIVELPGDRIQLSGVSARLLALLIARRSPVSTDWIIENLWPNVDPVVGRSRLKANLWRLRKHLGLERHDLVSRTSEGVELQPGILWRIDLWEFYDLASGSEADQIRAITLLSPAICDRQFRYDEEISIARIELRRRWSALALALLRSGALAPEQLADRVLATTLDGEEIVSELAKQLQRSRSPLGSPLSLRFDSGS